MEKRLSLLVLTTFMSIVLYGQVNKVIGNVDGLSSSLVNCVMHDSIGYLWIGTEYGLNRYDGKEIVVYNSDDGNRHIKSDYVQTIYENSDGELLIGLQKGLEKYDRESECFTEVPMMYHGSKVDAHVMSISEDLDGITWIGTAGMGLMMMVDGYATSETLFDGLLSIDFVSSVCVDRMNRLWIVSYKSGVYMCNLHTGDVDLIEDSGSGMITSNTFIREVDGRVYMNLYSGLYVYNEDEYKFIDSNFRSKEGSVVRSILSLDGELLVGTDGEGLYRFNLESNSEEEIRCFTRNIEVDKTKVHSIVDVGNNSLCLGLYQKGVILIPKNNVDVRYYGYNPNGKYNIGSSCVMSIKSVENGIWVGTDGDGLYFVDNEGESRHYVKNMPKTILDIKETENGLWLASYDKGLLYYNYSDESIIDYNKILRHSQSKFDKRATSLAIDSKKRLWVGTNGNGLFCLDGTTATSFVSTLEDDNDTSNELINNWINAMLIDNENLLIGTYNGLCCYNTEIDAFVNIDDILYKSIGNSIVFSMCKSDDGLLCFATNNGIILYDSTRRITTVLNKNNGLVSNVIISLIIDNDGLIWVGSYNGISCINPDSREINSFNYYDGLLNCEFSHNAVEKDKKGRIYFGGPSCISCINPKGIKHTDDDIQFCFSKLILDGKIEKKYISNNEYIEFYSDKKNIVIELKDFNYNLQNESYYEYKLDGYDTIWNCTEVGNNKIMYNKIKPGKYCLNVCERYGKNISEIKKLNFEIMPVWWQSWKGIILLILIALILYYLVLFFLKLNKNKNFEINLYKKSLKLDKTKLQYFFNISHEIRTPLTMIINPIIELLSKSDEENKFKYNFELIYKNSIRILKLVNQMLDISKLEDRKVKMKYSHTNIINFFKDISDSFMVIAEKKNIEIKIENKLENQIVDIDVNNFDKVIYNIFSNSIKFTQDGEIKVVLEEKDNDKLFISISDTGIGIDSTKTEKIFDPLYQDDENINYNKDGIGIGLYVARMIVEAHGGNITAENRKDTIGCLFKIIIPRIQEGATEEVENNYKSKVLNEIAEEKYRPVTNKKILLVDDENEMNEYLKSKLCRQYKLTTCNNGNEAYEKLLMEHYDLVITDIVMPEMNGLTLCRKIKSNININRIPVILLTIKNSDEYRNQGLMFGADAFITKPFDLEILRSTIANILANRDRIIPRTDINITDSLQNIKLKNSDEVFVEKIIKYVEENISDMEMNVEKIAKYIGISRTHFHRRIKAITGQNARDFIRNIRLKHAGKLLSEKRCNISDVAYALGFSNVSHFTTCFKTFYGITPTDYMNEHLKKKEE